MVGSAVVRRLRSEDCDVVTAPRNTVDLRDQRAVGDWLEATRPDGVVLAAAKVGGILANDAYPADFIYDNLVIEANVIHASFRASVRKLLFLGSSCIYPRLAAQPIIEDALLSGELEPTNQWYAVAKIAGIKMCQAYRRQHGCDFVSAMPTNLYGPGDNFDLHTSHVLPAMIRKMHDAKVRGTGTVDLWGTGRPKREFLYVDDCADGLVFLMKHYSADPHINIGTGVDIGIRDLALKIAQIVGYKGEITFDASKPDGTPRKLLDVSRLRRLGWSPKTSLDDGIHRTYRWFAEHAAERTDAARP